MKDKKQKAELDKEFKVAEEVAESDDLGLDREALGDDKYIEALEEKLGQAIAESVMCRNLTQRLQADFDNYRKRNASIAEEMKQLGISMVCEKLLGVLDVRHVNAAHGAVLQKDVDPSGRHLAVLGDLRFRDGTRLEVPP